VWVAGVARFVLGRRVIWRKLAIVVILALPLAIGLEVWALETSRWADTNVMPLIPLLEVGWLPTIQLALTGVLAVTSARVLKNLCPICRQYD